MAAQAQRAPDIRYSDVARYVSLSLMKEPPRPKSQVRLDPLKELASSRIVIPPPSGAQDEQVERMKTQLAWLRAQQKAEKEELHRLETCLSDSMLLEKKVHKKTVKDREKFEFHQKHAAQVGEQIQAIQAALQEASRKPEVASPGKPQEPPAGRSNLEKPQDELPEKPEKSTSEVRSQTAPELDRKRVEVVEEEPEVAEDSHITLKEYFDAADKRQKQKEAKLTQSQLMSASARSQGSSAMRSTFHSTGQSSFWRRPQLSPEELALQQEEHRQAIRRELIDRCGAPRAAFRKLDLNGSGNISSQEFADGVARMGVNWQAITGLQRNRDLFKMFDVDKDGVIVYKELFPGIDDKEPERVNTPDFWKKWVLQKCDVENARDPRWQPQTPEAELEQLFNTSESHESAAQLRKWMGATIRRLKNRGKSDARCREIVAAHLPRGTGPKDREDVQTFSSAEVKLCKKTYNDEVNDPVRNIQKVFYDMREQRRILHDSRQKLWMVTMAPLERAKLEEDRKSAAAAVGLSLGGLGGGVGSAAKETTDAPAQAKKSLKIIAQQSKMDEDAVEFLHKEFAAQADKSDMILKKGFQRLLKGLCLGRTISDSDSNYWWEQAVRTMPAPEDGRKVQVLDFERFAMWYATSEARTV
ncbi:unnamed protein product [Symbiodinium natans]|uniref:EF-hand domain-containing protein n=1 Tax=Symbiodinium natans TaxID=878477 RepID=A0A812N525_9DINO|nr:unnamed protein product [Symbiodinium natans]